jgi:hypothetical protein
MAKDNAALMVALGGLKDPKKAKPAEGDEAEAGDEEAPDLLAEAKADVATAFDGGDGAALADAIERLARACKSEDY